MASGITASTAADGTVTLSHGTNVPIPPGQTLDHTVSIAVNPNAAQSSNSSFYLVHSHGGAHGRATVLESGQASVFGHSTSARIDIMPPLTALQQWRQTHFGSSASAGNAANNADFDGDGVPNLVEYVTGTNPWSMRPPFKSMDCTSSRSR